MEQEPVQTSSISPTLSRDRSRKVRSRLGKHLMWLVAAVGILCFGVVWHRNATHIEKACARIEVQIEPVRQYLATHGTLPLEYPSSSTRLASKSAGFDYVDKDMLRWAGEADRSVLIAFGSTRGLIARPNGRAVAFYEDGRITVRWMPNSDFEPLLREQQLQANAAAKDSGS